MCDVSNNIFNIRKISFIIMKPTTKLYLKIFLYAGVFFGLLTVIMDLIFGDKLSIWEFLFSAIFFGFFMSLILVSISISRLKKMGMKDISDEDLAVKQKREIVSTFNIPEIIERLKKDEKTGKMKLKMLENGIQLSTGVSWESWGEVINIIQIPNGENKYKYQIISKPKLSTTIIDYGKNFENVKRIKKILEDTV